MEVLIIFPVVLQTVINFRMLPIGGQGISGLLANIWHKCIYYTDNYALW